MRHCLADDVGVCRCRRGHGSICEINGQWYVFYHRQCGLDQYSRQAMVDPITVEVEEGPDSAKKGHSICDVEDFLFTAK